jgi:ATP-dependent Zn protease
LNCSEQTAEGIDHDVRRMLGEAYAGARKILKEYRDQLELFTNKLIRCGTSDAKSSQPSIGRSPDH